MTTKSIDAGIVRGVNALLSEYARLSENDSVVIAYTPDSREPAAWITAGLKMRGLEPTLVAMQPLVDDRFEGRLHAALPDPSRLSGKAIILAVERDTTSHFAPLARVADRFGAERCVVVRLISASRALFLKALNLSPADLSRRNAALLNRLRGRKTIRVTSRGGTDLTITLDSSRYEWISNRGFWRPGSFVNVPAGEIATFPADIDGLLVADGAINCNVITHLDVRLTRNPLIVEVSGGKATNFHCSDDQMWELVNLCFRRAHGRNVGEVGFGTNSGIDDFVPFNSHMNERRPGVHLGFGQHNQDPSRVGYLEAFHFDLITDGAEISVDDGSQVIDLTRLAPTDDAHPLDVRDEDVVGDCCSFSYNELQARGG